jgi:hypothetical protein
LTAQLLNPRTQPWIVGHLIVSLQGTRQFVAAAGSARPVDSDRHASTDVLHINDDALDEEADDALTIRGSRAFGLPQYWDAILVSAASLASIRSRNFP